MAIVTSRRVPVGGRSLTLYEQFPLGRPSRSARSDSAERLSILVLISVGNSGCLVRWSLDAAFRISASLPSQANPPATRALNVLPWVEKFLQPTCNVADGGHQAVGGGLTPNYRNSVDLCVSSWGPFRDSCVCRD